MKGNLKLVSLVALLPFTTALSANHINYFADQDVEISQIATVEEPFRLIKEKDGNGRSIELDDGAIWSIHGKDSQQIVQNWRINDSVIIHPSAIPFWTGTKYYLYNDRTKTAANADLAANPFKNTATHLQISFIDYTHGDIQLVNGAGDTMFVKVNPKFYNEFSHWRVGSTIIMGSNQDCYAGWFSSYPYILINVARKNGTYIEALMD